MLSAAILAGGRATRFAGRDKGALLVEGRTILDRQMSELSRISNEILLVRGERLPEQAPRTDVITIADVMPGCGPLGGLHAALTAARNHVVVVVACDMPYVTAPFLAYLASRVSEPGEVNEYAAVVPHSEGRYHPLCAAYTRAALDPIERRLAAGSLTMNSLLADVRLRVIHAEDIAPFGDPRRLLANVNTPAEHEQLEALHNHEL
jgi:molybdopterin-guanine dinucleotide biosynthesis protein A